MTKYPDLIWLIVNDHGHPLEGWFRNKKEAEEAIVTDDLELHCGPLQVMEYCSVYALVAKKG